MLVILFTAADSFAAKQYDTWRQITDEMCEILDESYKTYLDTKDAEKAKEIVNHAYFDYYETLGVERNVKNYVSGKRASLVEYKFAEVKRLMTKGGDIKKIESVFNTLKSMLTEDSDKLDAKNKQENPWTIFLGAFLILLREGLEAILVVAAIAAYLGRSGNTHMTRVVYINAIAAIVASAILAYALQAFFTVSGANQEILEGATMLLAVVVLFCVSNWMISKAEAESWKHYIQGKVTQAITTGSAIALGAASFLAVFREGAETILFYQAMFMEVKTNTSMIWYGMLAAAACLIVIFMIIRFGTMRLPLKPFFIGTSIFMYIMCIAFCGGGIKELQEGDVIPATSINMDITVDLLGIYPTVETLVPQAILLVIAVFSFFYYKRKSVVKTAA